MVNIYLEIIILEKIRGNKMELNREPPMPQSWGNDPNWYRRPIMEDHFMELNNYE